MGTALRVRWFAANCSLSWMALACVAIAGCGPSAPPAAPAATASTIAPATAAISPARLLPRQKVDTAAYGILINSAQKWSPTDTLPEIKKHWEGVAERAIEDIDKQLQWKSGDWQEEVSLYVGKAGCYMSAGKPEEAYAVLAQARAGAEQRGGLAREWTLSSLIYMQGVASLRQGENDNCILCRGESSCILPISPAAVHQNPAGSRRAIEHFTEYLDSFPDDLEVRWLLNIAHMTLGEYPDRVSPRHLIPLDRFLDPSNSIGKFRDVGDLVGVNRFNQAGGAIMEDFDNDGLLDLAVTAFDPLQPLGVYRNRGDGRFEECSAQSPGLADQLGGLMCVQTDYNNDGLVDIYIPRGAWLQIPIRPSLLKNEGNFRFTDVTEEAGLLEPVNSNTAAWADFDNDGWLDLFVCCEAQPHRLYRNLGNGKFEEVSAAAGLNRDFQQMGKGSNWIDYDNDNFPDLFINYLGGYGQLYHNERNGTFKNVTTELGIDGPAKGFSCWAWDYNNDGWLDIFATSYDRSMEGIVKGILGQPHGLSSNKLFRNRAGQGFDDVTAEAGLDIPFAAMGSNFGDFDNDGWLDMYLGTGEPNLNALVPNRMFRNLGGQFVEITASAGVGHLQKGHAVACGDWDRDGNVDIFIQMGGAVDGDKSHNILFQNPGHDHAWITLKLVGTKTNRAAIGARIKVVTAGENPQTIHRHISSGSSFGGNPLEQTIGLAKADRIATLEIHWPTSDTTQVFHDVAVNQAIEITEEAAEFRAIQHTRVPLPK
jgi:hypothetical protein